VMSADVSRPPGWPHSSSLSVSGATVRDNRRPILGTCNVVYLEGTAEQHTPGQHTDMMHGGVWCHSTHLCLGNTKGVVCGAPR